MPSPFEQHRKAVTRYFEAPPDAPIVLSEQGRAGGNAFLYRLYNQLGSLVWIITLFHCGLDAYWKVTALPAGVIGANLSQTAIDSTRYWHRFYDPYPPANVAQMPEPYRTFFLLLDEDYTFYLSKMIVYSLFDRFRSMRSFYQNCANLFVATPVL